MEKLENLDITNLHAGLLDALEGLEEMISYVPPYFREKWGHQEYIDRAKAVLDGKPFPGPSSYTASNDPSLP